MLSCEIVGTVKPPDTPRMFLPDRMFALTQSVTFVRETVPPEVYPAGIVYVPAFVPIVPPVAPLFVIPPVSSPVDVKNFFPDRTLAEVASASPV